MTEDNNTWLLRRDPTDARFRRTHLCPKPQRDRYTDKFKDASVGDLWRCECGKVWKVVQDGRYHVWRRVWGLRGLWLRYRRKVVTSESSSTSSIEAPPRTKAETVIAVVTEPAPRFDYQTWGTSPSYMEVQSDD